MVVHEPGKALPQEDAVLWPACPTVPSLSSLPLCCDVENHGGVLFPSEIVTKVVGEAVTVTSIKALSESHHRKRWAAYATHPSR